MKKEIKNVSIKKYCNSNKSEYKALVESCAFPHELRVLEMQTLEHKKIFIMFIEWEEKSIFYNKSFIKPIGYCIVEDTKVNPINKGILSGIYNIPTTVIDEYPTIISDFMIVSNYRKLGYGRQLAEYVVYGENKNKKISLHAVEDGINFWDKIGFEYVDGMDSVMVIKGGERNA